MVPMMLRIDVLTTFPEMFAPSSPAALGVSIPARARSAGLVSWHATNLREYTDEKHQKTDDRPFGGGPGMVMMCQPIWDAVHAVEAQDPRPAMRILMTPQGTPMTQRIVEDLATRPRLLIIAGHYEGLDERVIEALRPMELSLGDYVISGGELAAMVLMDAVIRLLPGALGDDESTLHESFSFGQPTTTAKATPSAPIPLLDFPQYTRPREWMGRGVPEVLLSGDHAAIARWREAQRHERTQARRPDLLK
jgi:tRNA (guanine37-N1)-methyltransferase